MGLSEDSIHRWIAAEETRRSAAESAAEAPLTTRGSAAEVPLTASEGDSGASEGEDLPAAPDLADEATWKAELSALASSNAAMATLAREQVAAWLLRHRNDPDLSSVDVQRMATIAGVFTDKASDEDALPAAGEEELDLLEAPDAELELWRVAEEAYAEAEAVTLKRLGRA